MHAMYSFSRDDGQTFSTAVQVDQSSTSVDSPKVYGAYNDALAHIVWRQQVSGVYHIFYANVRNGVTVSTSARLDAASSNAASNQSIATDNSGNVHVTWDQADAPYTNLYYSRSTDGGASFSTPVVIDHPSQRNAGLNAIRVDGSGNVNVFIVQNLALGTAIYVSKSTDGGASFPTPRLR
jgi:hypothetical protein